MGYDLSNEHGRFCLNIWYYPAILNLAYKLGWEPQGTKPAFWCNEDGSPSEDMNKDNDKWNGSYFANSWQKVTADDAENLGKALDKIIFYLEVWLGDVTPYDVGDDCPSHSTIATHLLDINNSPSMAGYNDKLSFNKEVVNSDANEGHAPLPSFYEVLFKDDLLSVFIHMADKEILLMLRRFRDFIKSGFTIG